jgi:hypothetical protein
MLALPTPSETVFQSNLSKILLLVAGFGSMDKKLVDSTSNKKVSKIRPLATPAKKAISNLMFHFKSFRGRFTLPSAICIFYGVRIEMKLDTCLDFHQIHDGDGKKFIEQLLEISKHTVSGDAAAEWANNLRFIAVPEELSLGSANEKNLKLEPVEILVKKEDEKGTILADDKSSVGLNCVCDKWPKFPRQELPYLALTDNGAVKNCNHHVAVSYCWSRGAKGRESSQSVRPLEVTVKGHQLRPLKKQRLDQTPPGNVQVEKAPYDIMTSNGMRKGRVPRDVMDRALRYAANKGLSFIWIDQECIEQDNPVEKELAIQSMHLVYRRSEYPLGLLTARLLHQEHIEALKFAIRYSFEELVLHDADPRTESFPETPKSRPMPNLTAIESFIRNFAEVLKIMARDRWLTRGWIMQEMVLAGEKMVFSLPCEPCLVKPDWGGDVEGELHLTLDQLVPIFDDVLSSDAKAKEFDKIIIGMKGRQSIGYAFHASYRKLRHITLGTNADGNHNMWGNYRVCNPLAAVLFLEGRTNSRYGDRIAIVANLCDYAVRLNTTELDKLGFGYSTCLFAVMLLNGDITYMIEWAKATNEPRYNNTFDTETPSLHREPGWNPLPTFSWMPAPHASLSLGFRYAEFIDNGNLSLATIMDPTMQIVEPDFSQQGLHLRGWIWNIDQTVILRDFQRQLKRSWPSILEKAEHLDDFTLLAGRVAKLVISLFSTLLKADAQDLSVLLWHHLVPKYYLGDWSEHDRDLRMHSRLPKALVPSLPQLETILSKLTAGYSSQRKDFLSPQLILHLLLTRLEERSTAPPELEWIFNLIMAQGSLRWGRKFGSSGLDCKKDQSQAIAIFDCSESSLVLTPQMRDPTKDAAQKRQWMRHFRQQPGSWIIEGQHSTSILESDIPNFKTKGMVRGLWRIGDVKPQSYVLS